LVALFTAIPSHAAKLTEKHALPRDVKFVSLSFSPDGKILALGGKKGSVLLIDPATGKKLGELRKHEGSVGTLSWTADGKTLLTSAGEEQVYLWDVATFKVIAQIGTPRFSFCATFAPNGKTVYWGDWYGGVWAMALPPLQAPEKIAEFKDDPKVSKVAATPDGKSVISMHRHGFVKQTTTAPNGTTRNLVDPSADTNFIQALELSPDGRKLAMGFSRNRLWLWNLETGAKEKAFTSESSMADDSIEALAFSADGKALFSSSTCPGESGTNVNVWSILTGRKWGSFVTRDSPIVGLAASSDRQTLATLHEDGVVGLWVLPPELESVSLELGSVFTLKSVHGTARSVCFTPDGEFLACGGDDGHVMLWDLKKKAEWFASKAHKGQVPCLAFSVDGTILATGDAEGTIKTWDVLAKEEAHTMGLEKGPIHSLTFAPDGKSLVATGRDGFVHIWNVATGKERSAIRWAGEFPRCAAYSENAAALFVAGADGTLKRWGKIDDDDDADPPPVKVGKNPLLFSPDGKLLATGGMDGPIQFWHIPSRKGRAELKRKLVMVEAFALSPDSDRVAFADLGEANVEVWDLATGKQIAQLVGHEKPVCSVAFSPNGVNLATASKDGTVRVWRVPKSK
jgi:WD40 repeat protein